MYGTVPARMPLTVLSALDESPKSIRNGRSSWSIRMFAGFTSR
jgi:hypothetical protein